MSETVAFDRYTIDPARHQLYADGALLPVSKPGVRLLLALVERANELMTKDELIEHVWGSGEIAENTLHSQVSALRRAIGTHLIITESGRGYRFVGQLRRQPRTAAARPARDDVYRLTPYPDGRSRPLLGREPVLQSLHERIAADRLITLIGPGGVGKTRVAREFGQRCAAGGAGAFPDGVWFVELASCGHIDAAIDVLRVTLGVDAPPGAAPLDDLLAWMRPRSACLILDNCEHLMPAVARLVEDLLAGAPNLSIAATSRQALGCSAESVVAVPPLAVPEAETLRSGGKSPAFRLFCQIVSAQGVMPIGEEEAGRIARMCRRLDGLPLAIEIVAGWSGELGLEALEEKLGAGAIAWPHSDGNVSTRHHDLRSALAWSYELLGASEQSLLRALSVWTGAFSLADAESLQPGNAAVHVDLARLVRKSLLTVRHDGARPTYRLLATTRAFALEMLRAAGEEPAVRLRHADELLRRMTEAEQTWDASSSESWLARYAGLDGELREALDWAFGPGGDRSVGLSIVAVAWPLWRELSQGAEGLRRIGSALAALRPETPSLQAAQLRYALGMMSSHQPSTEARDAFADAARLFESLGDRKRHAQALLSLGFARFLLGEMDAAERAAQQGRALLDGRSARLIAAALDFELILATRRGQYEAGREAGLQAVRIYDTIGATRSAYSVRHNMLELLVLQGRPEVAIEEAQALAAALRKTVHTGLLIGALTRLTAALVRIGDYAAALASAREAIAIQPESAPSHALIDNLALGCAQQGRVEDAAMLMGYCDRGYADLGGQRQPLEQEAAQRTVELIERGLTREQADRLRRHGLLLSEPVAWKIAVGDAPAAPVQKSRGRGKVRP